MEELPLREGLTVAGAKRLKSNDVKCRPEKRYSETYFSGSGTKLRQFRLATVEDAASAEDCVLLWAHLTGRGAQQRRQHMH